jgi:hypothetical protein
MAAEPPTCQTSGNSMEKPMTERSSSTWTRKQGKRFEVISNKGKGSHYRVEFAWRLGKGENEARRILDPDHRPCWQRSKPRCAWSATGGLSSKDAA